VLWFWFLKGSDVKKKRKVSLARVVKAAESGEYIGFCMGCGAEAHGVEPDARKYECEVCKELKVYGAEELVLMLAF
jgi:hypothetical protein